MLQKSCVILQKNDFFTATEIKGTLRRDVMILSWRSLDFDDNSVSQFVEAIVLNIYHMLT